MNNFFILVKQTLTAEIPQEKFQFFQILQDDFVAQKLNFTPTEEVEIFKKPSYANFCTIVDPKEVSQRKNFESLEGQQTLLHAIAHIEYSAIDLALDACYRFQNMPLAFYQDWLEVASDEVRHFEMIVKELNQLGINYGDMPVHQGLFDASMKTLSLIPRMALIPRYMEANGLDANALLISKLKKLKNTESIIELLEVILQEEIEHVRKGDRWYKFGCNQIENLSCDYFEIVNKVYPNSFRTNKQVNVSARLQAGFSQEEIDRLLNY